MSTYQDLLNTDHTTLEMLYNTNNNLLCNKLWNDDNFWRDKLIHQLGRDLLENKPPNISWKDYYISQYKIIIPIDDHHQPIGQIYTTSISTLKDLILATIQLMGLAPDGNFSVTIRIGPYTMYSSMIVNLWYNSLSNLGVLGYLERNEAIIDPNLNDRMNIWSVIDRAVIEVFPLILRTQSKLRHSYLKLSSGRLLGAEYLHS